MDLRVPGPLSYLSVVTMRESFSVFHYEYLLFETGSYHVTVGDLELAKLLLRSQVLG